MPFKREISYYERHIILFLNCLFFLLANEVCGKSYNATIYRGRFGVSHIEAESLPDADFGVVYAQDRLKLVMETGTRPGCLRQAICEGKTMSLASRVLADRLMGPGVVLIQG